MGVLKLTIELDNVAKSYFAGQTITGNVIVDLRREKSFKELVITFFGKARVTWDKTKKQNNRSGALDVNEEEIYFNHKTSLFDAGGDSKVITLPRGRHSYPFSYQIPAAIPSSFYGTYGYTRYHVGALLRKDKPYNRDREVKVPFTINGILDLNNEVLAAAAGEAKKEVVVGSYCVCLGGGAVKFTMKMFRNGVVPGEYFPIVMELSNFSRKEVSTVHLSLWQEISYFATNAVKKMEKCSVVKVKREGLGPGETNVTWAGDIMKVPSVPPTKLGKCNLILVEYSLKLEMEIYGERNLVGSLPIIIGTIPLRNNFLDLVPPEGFDPDAEFFTPVNLLGYPDLPPPTYNEAIQMPSTLFHSNPPLYNDTLFSEHPDGPTVMKKRIVARSADMVDSAQGKRKEEDSDSDEESDDGETTLVSVFEGFVPMYVNYYDGKARNLNQNGTTNEDDNEKSPRDFSMAIRESTIM